MTRYAAQTEVSSDRSRAEIERTLARYGASRFLYGWEQDRAVVAFEMHGRQIRLTLPLPRRDDPEFTETPTGLIRSEKSAADAYERAVRQRWRALALVVKAKLEAIETGIADFETEWLGYVVIPATGQTYGEYAIPQLAEVYERGGMPALLQGLDQPRLLKGPQP